MTVCETAQTLADRAAERRRETAGQYLSALVRAVAPDADAEILERLEGLAQQLHRDPAAVEADLARMRKCPPPAPEDRDQAIAAAHDAVLRTQRAIAGHETKAAEQLARLRAELAKESDLLRSEERASRVRREALVSAVAWATAIEEGRDVNAVLKAIKERLVPADNQPIAPAAPANMLSKAGKQTDKPRPPVIRGGRVVS